MAKFQDKNLKLRYNQRAYFGDNDDCSIWHDGADFRVSCTLSGVDPTQEHHLTTKKYVDDLTFGLDWQDSVLTISGAPPAAPSTGDRYLITVSGASGAWTGHEDDIVEWDGAAWDFISPNEGFATFVEDEDVVYVYSNGQWVKMASIFDHGGLAGLLDDDHPQYILVDGSRGFTSTVSGVYPTQSYHLVTKQYVDDEISTISGVSDHGTLSGLLDDDHPQYILVDGSRGFTSTVSGVDPTQSYHLATKQYVDDLDFIGLPDTPVTYSGYGGYFVTVNAAEDALEFTTGSGVNSVLDHGLLQGLDDDDHPLYVPHDGTRGFTATVSGVYPTQSYHLTTKEYVDDNVHQHRTGRVSLVLDSDNKTVSFSTPMSDTNYSVSVIMRNSVDEIKNKAIYPMIITSTTVSGFSVLFSGDIDSNNYSLDYLAVSD